MNQLTREPAIGRARPLPVDERRAMIVDAITPLLLEHGRDLTSRQLAEASGIAEGTLYRAFGDKESLIDAAIARYLDPEPMRASLREIDPGSPLEEKVFMLLAILRERFARVFRIMAVLGADRPNLPSQGEAYFAIVRDCLAPDVAQLKWTTNQIGQVIRLVAFSTAFPQLNEGLELTTEELTSIVLHGVAGAGPDTHPRESS